MIISLLACEAISSSVFLFVASGRSRTLDIAFYFMFIDIPEYEGLYKIDEFGNILSKAGFILKKRDNGNGYIYACLWKNGKDKYFGVHRLVAKVFLPKIKGKNIVNHKDTNKTNNHYSNLEWCTPSENARHTKNMGHSTFGTRNPMNKLSENQVREIRLNYHKKNQSNTNAKELAKFYNISQGTINNIVSRRQWGHLI